MSVGTQFEALVTHECVEGVHGRVRGEVDPFGADDEVGIVTTHDADLQPFVAVGLPGCEEEGLAHGVQIEASPGARLDVAGRRHGGGDGEKEEEHV